MVIRYLVPKADRIGSADQLTTVTRVDPFYHSSSLLSVYTTGVVDSVGIIVTVSDVKSFIPRVPAPLSSRREVFFVRSSSRAFYSYNTLLLCFTGESLPLYETYDLVLPFYPVSTEWTTKSVSLFRPSTSALFAPGYEYSPIILIPMFPSAPGF